MGKDKQHLEIIGTRISRSKSRRRSRSKSRARSRSKSRGHSRLESRERSRSESRGRSRLESRRRSRSELRGCSKSKSRRRSRSKSEGCSRLKSRGHHPDTGKYRQDLEIIGTGLSSLKLGRRSRLKSRGSSMSESRGRSRSKSRKCSRSKSRGRHPERKKIMIDQEDIKKLAYIAEAHYNAAPQGIRDSADKFFWSMVKHRGNCYVTLEEFLESMNEKGYPEYAIPELFQILVKDSNMGMTMLESRSVYYILLSGRPFCSWCKIFIPADIYFCCSNCSAKKYALCLHCYANKAYVKHRHYGDHNVFFFDYTILHTTIKTTSAPSYQESGSSLAIVKTDDGKNKLKTALTVVKAALNVGGTVLSIASTFGACTIM